jgi:hypothetical protein
VAVALILNADIHAVLTVCGFMDVGTHTWIINNEGFQSLMDFGVLDDDKDVLEMLNIWEIVWRQQVMCMLELFR